MTTISFDQCSSIARFPGSKTLRGTATRLGIAASLALALLVSPLTVLAAPIDQKPTDERKPTETHPQIVLDAIKKYEGGDADGAYKLLQDAFKQHAHLPPPRVMMANLFFTDNQLAMGRLQLEQAVIDHPADPEPRFIFGDIAVRERRLSDAEAQYAKGWELLRAFKGDEKRKQGLAIQYYSGQASVAEGRALWETAQKYLAQLLKLQPDNASAHQRMATTLFGLGKIDEAYAEAAVAVKQQPALSPPAMHIAALYQQRGQLEDAGKWLQRAAKESPKDHRPRTALARWHWDNGDLDQADALAQEAEKLAPNSDETKLLVATIARFRKAYPKAESYFEEILRRSPSNFMASNQLALILAEQPDESKKKRAFELARMNINQDPKNVEAATTLGWVLFQMDRLDEAQKSLQMAASGSRISRDAAYYMARLAHKKGNTAEAQKFLKSAIDSQGPFAHLDEAKQWQAQLAGPQKAQ